MIGAKVRPGDVFEGFQKSLSKKSENFFSELKLTIQNVDLAAGTLQGSMDKRIISISGDVVR